MVQLGLIVSVVCTVLSITATNQALTYRATVKESSAATAN
jgi:hypothetical protein